MQFYRYRCSACGYRILTMRKRALRCTNHKTRVSLVPAPKGHASTPRSITASELTALFGNGGYGDVFP